MALSLIHISLAPLEPYKALAVVTLLKDATAKALSGSKGANGVVVIETKKPEAGKLKISYTGNLNIQGPDLSSYNLCNAARCV